MTFKAVLLHVYLFAPPEPGRRYEMDFVLGIVSFPECTVFTFRNVRID